MIFLNKQKTEKIKDKIVLINDELNNLQVAKKNKNIELNKFNSK